MISIKILGILMIVASCSLIGISMGSDFRNRYKNLNYLINCIHLLETEILYLSNPLPEALNNIFLKGNKKVSFIFNDIKNNLVNDKNTDVFDSFQKVLLENRNKLCFNNEDYEAILSLGKILGITDTMDQKKHIKSFLTVIENQRCDAEIKMNKNEKLYNRLGILAGVAIAIILL